MTGRIVKPPLRKPLLPMPMKVGMKKRQIARSSKGLLRVDDHFGTQSLIQSRLSTDKFFYL
jgi:hypothetical protein